MDTSSQEKKSSLLMGIKNILNKKDQQESIVSESTFATEKEDDISTELDEIIEKHDLPELSDDAKEIKNEVDASLETQDLDYESTKSNELIDSAPDFSTADSESLDMTGDSVDLNIKMDDEILAKGKEELDRHLAEVDEKIKKIDEELEELMKQ